MSVKSVLKTLISIILITVMILGTNASYATTSEKLTNTDDQYMELKVVSVEDVAGADKQVILEWWSYNLTFKGLDLRFSYDTSKVKPSNITNNAYITDSNGEDSFAFTSDFSSYLDYFVSVQEDTDYIGVTSGTYKCSMSLYDWDENAKYIEKDSSLGYVVNTNVDGGVLLGRMSFRLFSDNLSTDTFELKTDENHSPNSGIKISQTMTTGYEDQSVFRFSVLSNDATLKGIAYDFFNYNKDDGTIPELTYTDIDMTKPDSDSTDELQKYTLVLTEAKENISLKITPNESNATVKVNGNTMDLTNSKELVLKALGEGDTEIEIEVTAQDGATVQKYKLVVHRPYGTIKGSIYTSPTALLGKYIAKVKVFDSDSVSTVAGIDWSKVTATGAEGEAAKAEVHDKLGTLTPQEKTTNEDGTYEIYVVPGTYDVLIDKESYLDCIYISRQVNEGDVIDLGNIDLKAGDLNKDGKIDISDVSTHMIFYGCQDTDPTYDEIYDFNLDSIIDVSDFSFIVSNYEEEISIL